MTWYYVYYIFYMELHFRKALIYVRIRLILACLIRLRCPDQLGLYVLIHINLYLLV
jgi:hypothetical protein